VQLNYPPVLLVIPGINWVINYEKPVMTEEPEKTAPKRDYLFKKGQSGNPAGRPKGSRNKAIVALEAIFDDAGKEIANKVLDLAKAGDMGAIKLALERVLPPRRDRPISFELPNIENAADLAKASAALIAGIAAGDITPSEASDISKSIETHVRVVETRLFEERLQHLEAKLNGTASLD
jgi:hypothetical protein